ncbi:Protein melted [Hypsibius exemplaris]|uniref:Protein melted n=1 Tax=Hypsibius exemplaris TaxID=2072580 RepID=A0A9X6NJ38_HYPEX|nr:Protein melted [Hypsibius exemplaris]
MHPVFARVLQFSDLSIAGDLFYLPDSEIVKDLPQVCSRLEEIIMEPSYLTSANDQSVVEICITRLTAALKNTGALSQNYPLLLRLLSRCLEHDLTPKETTGEDPPHAKIASDLINCVFLNYSKRDIMEKAMPIGIEFLQANNAELTRNMSSYLSLIVIQQPFLASLYVTDILRAILRGNLQLTKVLPQLYTVNPKPVLDNLQSLLVLFGKCGETEKDSLLNLCGLIVRDQPQNLWPVVGILVDMMSDPTCILSVLRIFSLIAGHSAVPFLTHMTKFKKIIDGNPNALPAAARIFGAIGQLNESCAKDSLNYLIPRSVTMDPVYVSYVMREIEALLETYPNLRPEANAILAKQAPCGSSNIAAVTESLNSSSPAILNESEDRFVRLYEDRTNPPPYYGGTMDFGDLAAGQRAQMPRTSPFTSRIHGLGKSSVEMRQTMATVAASSNRPRPQFYGSASHVPMRLTTDVSPRTLGSSNGSVGANAKASQHSLQSRNNSRHSLVSSGFLSTANQKDSRHSIFTGNRATGQFLGKGSSTELSAKNMTLIPSLSPIYSRTGDDVPLTGVEACDSLQQPLPTFTLENPSLSKSTDAIYTRSRRNSRHGGSLAPRPRSRLLETGNQPQVIQVVPIHDAVYQFCERNLEKIRKYMQSVLVRFPLPVRCAIEQHKSRKQCKLFFACQCKGDRCLYAARFFAFSTKIPKVWIHLMFLAIQAKAGSALNQQDSAVHGLKLCWDHLDSGKDFATLVTSAFPTPAAQEEMLRELSQARYFDVFEYNASIKQWGCFLCNYPEKASSLFSNGAPLMEGVLKEKKGRWKAFKRWKSRYFTLSGPYLTYKSSAAKMVPIDMRRIRSLKAVNARGIRSIPTVFEVFTNDDKIFLLKAKDPTKAEQWLQCLQIAMAQSQSEEYGRVV